MVCSNIDVIILLSNSVYYEGVRKLFQFGFA